MSLQDIKRFMFISFNLNLLNLNESNDLIKEVNSLINKLIADGKGFDLLKQLVEFANFYVQVNNPKQISSNDPSVNSTIDCLMLLLAACSLHKKDEKFSHQVYATLNQLADTPVHLFAFAYYRKFLMQNIVATQQTASPTSASQVNAPKKIGRGLKKSLAKWYTSKNDYELLRLVTQYKHSYDWSNKDLIKLAHVKANGNGKNLILKYVLFGYDKIKNESKASSDDEAKLVEFINDVELLKSAKQSQEAVSLIKKHHLNFDHLPGNVRKFKEIWPVLVENLSLKDFCQSMNILFKKNLFAYDTPSERYINEKLLNKDNDQVKQLNPIYACLATQIYEQLTSIRLVKMFNQTSLANTNASNSLVVNNQQTQSQDRIKDALWSTFHTSIQHRQKEWFITQRIICSIDVNGQMRNDHTFGIHCLNPIDTSACIMLTMFYMSERKELYEMYAITDKLNKLELTDSTYQGHPDLLLIESLFQGFASIEKNPNEKVFEIAMQKSVPYDAFIFMCASDSNSQKLIDEMEAYRKAMKCPTSKLVLVNLTRSISENSSTKNPLSGNVNNLIINGWNFDSFFVLESFLKNKF